MSDANEYSSRKDLDPKNSRNVFHFVEPLNQASREPQILLWYNLLAPNSLVQALGKSKTIFSSTTVIASAVRPLLSPGGTELRFMARVAPIPTKNSIHLVNW